MALGVLGFSVKSDDLPNFDFFNLSKLDSLLSLGGGVGYFGGFIS